MAGDVLQHLAQRGSFVGQTKMLFDSLKDFLDAVHALKQTKPGASKPGKKERFCAALASADFSMSQFGRSFVKGKLSQSFGGAGNELTRVLDSFDKLYQSLKSSGDHIIQISNDEDLQIIALTLYLVDYLLNPPDVRDKLVLTARQAQRVDLPAKRNLIQEKCIVLRSFCFDKLKAYLENETARGQYEAALVQQQDIQAILQTHTRELLVDVEDAISNDTMEQDLLDHLYQALKRHQQALQEAYRSAALLEVHLLQGDGNPLISVRPVEDRALLEKLMMELQEALGAIHPQALTTAQEEAQDIGKMSHATEVPVSTPASTQEAEPVPVQQTADVASDDSKAAWERLRQMTKEVLQKLEDAAEAGATEGATPPRSEAVEGTIGMHQAPEEAAEMTAASGEDDADDDSAVAASLFQSAATDSGEKLTVKHIDQFIRLIEQEIAGFKRRYEAMPSKDQYQETKELIDHARVLLNIFKGSDTLKGVCCSVLQSKSISRLHRAWLATQVGSVLTYHGILSETSPLRIAIDAIKNNLVIRVNSGVIAKNDVELSCVIMGLYILERCLNAPPIVSAGDVTEAWIPWEFWTVPPAHPDLHFDHYPEQAEIDSREAKAISEREQALEAMFEKKEEEQKKKYEKNYPAKSGCKLIKDDACFLFYCLFSAAKNIAWTNARRASLKQYIALQKAAKSLLADCNALGQDSNATLLQANRDKLAQYLERLKVEYDALPEWEINVGKLSETVIGPADVPYPEMEVKGYAHIVPIRRLLEKTKLQVEAEQKRLASIQGRPDTPTPMVSELQSPSGTERSTLSVQRVAAIPSPVGRESILSPVREKSILGRVCEVYAQAITVKPPSPNISRASVMSDQSAEYDAALKQIEASLHEARGQVDNITLNLTPGRMGSAVVQQEKYLRLFRPHQTSTIDLQNQLGELLDLQNKISDWSNQLKLISDTFDCGSDDKSKDLAIYARRGIDACQRYHTRLMEVQAGFLTKNQDEACQVRKLIEQQETQVASFNNQHRVALNEIQNELTQLNALRDQVSGLSGQFKIMKDVFQGAAANEAFEGKVNQSLEDSQQYAARLDATQQTLLAVQEKQLSLNKRDAARGVLVATMIAQCESYLVERRQSFVGRRDLALQFFFGWFVTSGQKKRELYVQHSLEKALDNYGKGEINLDALLPIITDGKRQFKGGRFASGLLEGFEQALKAFGAKELADFNKIEVQVAEQMVRDELRQKECKSYSAVFLSKSKHAFFHRKQYAAQAQAWSSAAENAEAFTQYIDAHAADDRFAKWSSTFKLFTR
jgi:hypothetical protein